LELSEKVDLKESIGRYLPEKSYFSTKYDSVKPKAFIPTRDLQLSVYRIDGLEWVEIWEIGQKQVIDVMLTPKLLHGIAKIKAGKFIENGLVIDPDNSPPRHATVRNWPEYDAECLSKAQILAAEAILVLNN